MVRNQDGATMTIAGLAREGGVGVETVRYYQRRGLLATPGRHGASPAGGGVRRYGAQDIRHLRFIRSAQAAGFTLEQVAELLKLEVSDDRARTRILARERIAALDAKIAALEAARNALEHLEHACSATTTGLCPIMKAFEEA